MLMLRCFYWRDFKFDIVLSSFLLSTIFNFFFTHNASRTQQNKTTDIYSTFQGPIKREGEREGQQEHKSHSFIQSRISTKKHCQASMVEGLAPPTRAVAHSHVTICRRLWIQYVFLHMCGVNQFWIIVFFTAVKPANNILFCIELIQRPESSLRRHKLGLTVQSIRSNDDIVLSSDCRYQSLSIFSNFLNVVKTLSWSFSFAIWANGNAKK